MTNRFNFSDHQMLPGNLAWVSIGLPTVGSSVSIIAAPPATSRIKVLSAGINVNGSNALGVKIALTDGVNQMVIGCFGIAPGDRSFTNGWDLAKGAALFAQPVDVQGGVSWASLNVEWILITD